MDTDFIKVELKTEEQEDAEKTEEVINFTCRRSSLHRQVGMGTCLYLYK